MHSRANDSVAVLGQVPGPFTIFAQQYGLSLFIVPWPSLFTFLLRVLVKTVNHDTLQRTGFGPPSARRIVPIPIINVFNTFVCAGAIGALSP